MQIEQYLKNNDKMILRDYLALDRTNLANQRTFLAYIRSAIGMLAAGIGMIQFIENALIGIIGIALIVLSLPVTIIGVFQFRTVQKRLKSLLRNDELPQ